MWRNRGVLQDFTVEFGLQCMSLAPVIKGILRPAGTTATSWLYKVQCLYLLYHYVFIPGPDNHGYFRRTLGCAETNNGPFLGVAVLEFNITAFCQAKLLVEGRLVWGSGR